MVDISVGTVFSRLTVIGKVTKFYDNAERTFFRCECVCGAEKDVLKYNLLSGGTKSCGCLNTEGKDYTPYLGKKFNRLTLISVSGIKDYAGLRHTHVICECECGNTVETQGGLVISGKKKSCGCIGRTPQERLAKCVQTLERVAVREGREWTLTKELTTKLIQSDCHYCGLPAKDGTQLKGVRRNGIDRVDSSKGYLPDNVVPCCKDCNRAKLALTQEQFKDLISRIYNHYVKGN